MTLTRDFSYEQLATIKAFFTEAEWDTIDAALEEYKCYADDEAACLLYTSPSPRDTG